MTLNVIYVLLIVIGTVAVVKIVPMLKDKKVTNDEKTEIMKIVFNAVKDGLEITELKDRLSIQTWCVTKVMSELETQGYTEFSKADVEIAVGLALNALYKGKVTAVVNTAENANTTVINTETK